MLMRKQCGQKQAYIIARKHFSAFQSRLVDIIRSFEASIGDNLAVHVMNP